MDEVVGSAKVVLEGIDKISPAVTTSIDTLKKWAASGADVQRQLIQAAQKHQQTLQVLNQIYAQNQQAAQAAGGATTQAFNAGTQAAQQLTQAVQKVPPSLINIGQAGAVLQKQVAGYFSIYAIEEFIRKSYMAFTSHEEHMRRIQLAFGGTTEEIKKLHGELSSLAAAVGSTTEKMTDDLRAFMAGSGLGRGEALEAFKGIAMAADEAGIHVQDMSRIATMAMAQLQISTREMPQLMGSMGKAFAEMGAAAARVLPNIITLMQQIGLTGKANLQAALAIAEVSTKATGDAEISWRNLQTILQQMGDPESKLNRQAADRFDAFKQNIGDTIDAYMIAVDWTRDVMKRHPDIRSVNAEMDWMFGHNVQLQEQLKHDAAVERDELYKTLRAQKDALGNVKEIDEAHQKFVKGSIDGTRRLSQALIDVAVSAGGFLDSIGMTDTLHSTVTDLQHLKELIEWFQGKSKEGEDKGGVPNDASEYRDMLRRRIHPPAKPEIKPHQSGGVVSEPTLAMIGEAGPEAVVPLTRGFDMRGASGGTQAERDAGTMWARLHGLALTRTKHIDLHGKLTQETIDKLMGGGGSSGGGGASGDSSGASGTPTGTSSTTGDSKSTGDSKADTGGTQPAPPGAEGTFRPVYKLGGADLSDAVVNTIAGEAYTNNQESVDAVINNMLNRVGSKGWGPSGDMQQVARARGQYAGYRKANAKEAEFIRNRIKAIASGGVKDNTGGSNEYRAGSYRGPWYQHHRDAPVVGGNRFGFNPKVSNGPYAPYPTKMMAKGGIVTKPTLATIGENGPEAVVPLQEVGTKGQQQQFWGMPSEGGKEGEADLDPVRALAFENEKILGQPGRHRASQWHEWLKQNPYGRGVSEGEAIGTNPFGVRQKEYLKQLERTMEVQGDNPDLDKRVLEDLGPRPSQASLTGGGGSSGGAGASMNFGGGFGGGETSAPEGYTPSVANIHPNAHGFLNAIASTETDFSEREAYSDATNVKSYGGNTSMYDYGYYQMAQRDIDYAVKTLHMSPEIAQHLTGGPDHKSTLDQQTASVNEYLQRRYPDAYRNLVERGDYEGMRQATRHGKSWVWFGLKDKPKQALTEYNKVAQPQTTAVTPLPKSRPASAQASAQTHFNNNPIQVPVAPAKLGAHRQSFARSAGWAQRKAHARSARQEATVHTGEM
jgi:hypothetical protein